MKRTITIEIDDETLRIFAAAKKPKKFWRRNRDTIERYLTGHALWEVVQHCAAVEAGTDPAKNATSAWRLTGKEKEANR